MVTSALFGLLTVSGLGVGLAMIVIPSWWNSWVLRTVEPPFSRFLLLQGMILAGLILLVGTSESLAAWLWGSVGGLIVGGAMLLLVVPDRLRDRLLGWYGASSLWVSRLVGVGLVALATLLGIHTIRGGP